MTPQKSFIIPLERFKREYLPIPHELAQCFGTDSDKIPLNATDNEGKEYIVDLYPQQALIGGLGEWYRTSEPSPNSSVVITVDPETPYTVRLSLERAGLRKGEGLLIGRRYNMVASRKYELGPPYRLAAGDLLTHVFICGVTGSGKTVLGKAIVEEAALHGIPSILIDLKGDLSSLAITLSSFQDEEFAPWVEATDDEERRGAAREAAERYRQELSTFDLGEPNIAEFGHCTEVRIFTPRSSKGLPVSFAS